MNRSTLPYSNIAPAAVLVANRHPAEATRYQFLLPIHTKNPLNNSQGTTRGGMYMRARERAAQRGLVGLALSPARKRLTALLHETGLIVTLTRCAPSSGLDDDAIAPSMKSIRDGIADVLGLKTDRTPLITWRYAQQRSKPKVYQVHVTIERRGEPCERI